MPPTGAPASGGGAASPLGAATSAGAGGFKMPSTSGLSSGLGGVSSPGAGAGATPLSSALTSPPGLGAGGGAGGLGAGGELVQGLVIFRAGSMRVWGLAAALRRCCRRPLHHLHHRVLGAERPQRYARPGSGERRSGRANLCSWCARIVGTQCIHSSGVCGGRWGPFCSGGPIATVQFRCAGEECRVRGPDDVSGGGVGSDCFVFVGSVSARGPFGGGVAAGCGVVGCGCGCGGSRWCEVSIAGSTVGGGIPAGVPVRPRIAGVWRCGLVCGNVQDTVGRGDGGGEQRGRRIHSDGGVRSAVGANVVLRLGAWHAVSDAVVWVGQSGANDAGVCGVALGARPEHRVVCVGGVDRPWRFVASSS